MGIGVGTGLAIAGGVGALGALGGGLIASSSAKDASKAQTWAAQMAAMASLNQYNQTRSDLAPYRDAGANALGRLGSFFNGSNPNGELAALESTPGYQFALQQGLKSVQNSATARGLGISGAAMKGAANFATGLAQNTYQANLLNPLMALAGLGETATSQGGTLGNNATQYAGNAFTGGANANAAGQVASGNALGNSLTSISQLPLQYLLYNNFLGGGNSAGSGATGPGTGVYPGVATF